MIEAGTFLLKRVVSARRAPPGTWWWSTHGNIRIRCPLCTAAYRLEIPHRDVQADGAILYGIEHRVKGCRGRYAVMQLVGWGR